MSGREPSLVERCPTTVLILMLVYCAVALGLVLSGAVR